MTSAIDMIYKAVYKRCKSENCDEITSRNAATGACDDFKKNKFNTASKLIEQAVTAAKKMRKKVKR